MGLLKWNRRKVQNLSPLEIWLIAGRVFVGLGVGILAMAYYPRFALPAAVPFVVLGLILMAIAFKGFVRKGSTIPE
jgi:hypothetical protein